MHIFGQSIVKTTEFPTSSATVGRSFFKVIDR
jgi:hypothetical protein